MDILSLLIFLSASKKSIHLGKEQIFGGETYKWISKGQGFSMNQYIYTRCSNRI